MVRWTDVPIHFIDFEGSLATGVLEYGIVTLVGEAVTEVATRLCSSSGRIRFEDTAVHGIDEAAVAGAAPLSADWELFAGLRERGPFAAHYAQAENSLIKSVWPYARTSPSFGYAETRHTPEWGPWIDTGRICTELFPSAASGRLADTVAMLGLQAQLDDLALKLCPTNRRMYHAALYDALAGALILIAVSQTQTLRDGSLVTLFEHSTANPLKRSAFRQGELF